MSQFTVFISILDPAMGRAAAEEMLGVLKPDGAIPWFDCQFTNPWNPTVRGIGAAEIGQLFPNCKVDPAARVARAADRTTYHRLVVASRRDCACASASANSLRRF